MNPGNRCSQLTTYRQNKHLYIITKSSLTTGKAKRRHEAMSNAVA